MSLDPYDYCYCGSGKKAKFCCSRDILPEVDKIVRAMEGGQRVSALNQITRLLEKKGDRPVLLGLQATVQLDLGNLEGAQATAERLEIADPTSAAAAAILATCAVVHGDEPDLKKAVDKVQDALDRLGELLIPEILTALSAVGQALVVAGEVIAGRAYLQFYASTGSEFEGNDSGLRLLRQINAAAQVPILFKAERLLDAGPDDAEWAESCRESVRKGQAGRWRTALAEFQKLAIDYPNESAILNNIAALQLLMIEDIEAVKTLHEYARCTDVSLDKAVEAEAMAQLLQPTLEDDEYGVRQMSYVWPIEDVDAIVEKLEASDRTEAVNIDPDLTTEDDEPAPRFAFGVFDRPKLESAENLQAEDVPVLLARVLIYGKQVDRAARLEIAASEANDMADVFGAVRAIVPEIGGDPESEKEVGRTDPSQAALECSWRLPDGISLDRERELTTDKRQSLILTRWTEMKLSALQGKTPREASQIPALRIPLLGAIVLLEQALPSGELNLDMNKLRTSLGLPVAEPIVVDEDSLSDIPVVFFPRIQVEKLSDDMLAVVYRFAERINFLAAMHVFAGELVQRPDVDTLISPARLYGALARSTPDSGKAVDFLQKAQAATVEEGNSPGQFLLAEVQLRFLRRESDEAQALLTRLHRDHMDEPYVREAIYSMYLQLGLINPDGTLVERPQAAAPPQAAGVGAAASPTGGIWTPGAAAQQPAESNQPSKLWTPGMD